MPGLLQLNVEGAPVEGGRLPPITVRREGAALPREIVAWLKTLGLTRPLRHPRRDLSNGFLIAEMCARYWGDVPMHSFENKLSVENKKSNWVMLKKVFERHNAPLSEQMVRGMIAQTEGFADYFLRQLYTVLTGRQVREAAPLISEEVHVPKYCPNRIAHHLKPDPQQDLDGMDELTLSTPHRQGAAAHAVGPNDLTGSKAETGGFAKLNLMASSSADAADPPEAVQPIRRRSTATVFDGADQLGSHSLEPEAARGSDGRAQVTFTVATHVATVTSTVVPRSQLEAASQQSDGATAAPTGSARGSCDGVVGPVTGAMEWEWIERVVRPIGLAAGWSLSSALPTYTQYFVATEQEMEPAMQNSVWGTVLSRLADLVAWVRSDPTTLSALVQLILVHPEGPLGVVPAALAPETTSPTLDVGGTLPPRRSYVPSARAYGFLAAMFSHLTGVDPFYSQVCFIRSILQCPALQPILSRLNFATADMYATLLCAVVSLDLPTAQHLLPELITAAHEALVSASDGDVTRVSGRVSFLLLLRLLITRIVRVSSNGSFFRRPINTRHTEGREGIHAILHHVGMENAIAGLTSAHPSLRLAGGGLAVALVQSGCPLHTAAMQVLFPDLPNTRTSVPMASLRKGTVAAGGGPWIVVVQAMWLHALQRRRSDEAAAALGASDEMCEDVSARSNLERPTHSEAADTTAPGPEVAFRSVCAYLTMPGGHVISKAIVAYELACVLGTLDARRPIAAEIAFAVMLFFGVRAPPALRALAVAPPTDAAGCAVPLISGTLTAGDDRASAAAAGAVGGNGSAPLLDVLNTTAPSCAVDHPILGPLSLRDMMRRTAPLLLCEALPQVFHNVNNDDPKDAARRLAARVAVLARDRSVSEGVRMRIEWMYGIIVSGRGGAPLMELGINGLDTPPSDIIERWQSICRARYNDFALVTMAAETISRQGTSRTDQSTVSLLDLAAMAKEVIVQWYTELAPGKAAPLHSRPTAGSTVPQRRGLHGETDKEKLVEAMAWFHASFSDPDSRWSR